MCNGTHFLCGPDEETGRGTNCTGDTGTTCSEGAIAPPPFPSQPCPQQKAPTMHRTSSGQWPVGRRQAPNQNLPISPCSDQHSARQNWTRGGPPLHPLSWPRQLTLALPVGVPQGVKELLHVVQRRERPAKRVHAVTAIKPYNCTRLEACSLCESPLTRPCCSEKRANSSRTAALTLLPSKRDLSRECTVCLY